MKYDFSNIDSKFIKDNEAIIWFSLKKYLYGNDVDDILQEARIWLLEAKNKHDFTKASWVHFARLYIIHQYLTYCRTNNSQKRSDKSCGYTSVCFDDLYETELFDYCKENVNKTLDDKLEAEFIYKYCLDKIEDDKARDIVKMKSEGATNRIIAYKYKMTEQGISYIYCREINKLRGNLKKTSWAKEFFDRRKIPINIHTIIKMRNEGRSWQYISKYYNVALNTLKAKININDYPIGENKC